MRYVLPLFACFGKVKNVFRLQKFRQSRSIDTHRGRRGVPHVPTQNSSKKLDHKNAIKVKKQKIEDPFPDFLRTPSTPPSPLKRILIK
jgi:hypothetical protein